MDSPVQRTLLGFFVVGYSAAWIEKQIRDLAPAQVANLRQQGRNLQANALESTMFGITAAAELYHRRIAENGEVTQRTPAAATAYLTTKEVALRLGVSDRQVRNLLTDGALVGSNRTGRWLVEEVSVEEYQVRKAAA